MLIIIFAFDLKTKEVEFSLFVDTDVVKDPGNVTENILKRYERSNILHADMSVKTADILKLILPKLNRGYPKNCCKKKYAYILF